MMDGGTMDLGRCANCKKKKQILLLHTVVHDFSVRGSVR